MVSFSAHQTRAAASLWVLALSGCGSIGRFPGLGTSAPTPQAATPEPEVVPEIPDTIQTSRIVGRWGYASFHRPQDRARTEVAAKQQCAHPFVIGQGPTGGVMMYPPDQTQMREFWLKGSSGAKNYIGLPGDAGGTDDREILSFDGRVMLLRFMEPEVAGRFGTGIYVRYAPQA